MKISNILIALVFVFTLACTGKPSGEHGHEHGSDTHEHTESTATNDPGHSHDGEEGHSHDNDEDHHHEQEEFTVEGDSTKGTHTHEDSREHEDHDH